MVSPTYSLPLALILSILVSVQSNYITAGKWSDDVYLLTPDEDESNTNKIIQHSLPLVAGSEVYFELTWDAIEVTEKPPNKATRSIRRAGDTVDDDVTSVDGTSNEDTGDDDDGIDDDGTSNEGTDDEGTNDEGTSVEGTDDEGTGDEGTSGEGTGVDGTPNEGTSVEGTGDEGTSVEGTGGEGTGGEGTGDEGTSVEGTGGEGTGGEGTGGEGEQIIIRTVIVKSPCSILIETNFSDLFGDTNRELYGKTEGTINILKGSGFILTHRNITQPGNYHLFVWLSTEGTLNSINITGQAKTLMYSWYGYLSAKHYPFLIFYSLMTVAYLIMNVAWLVLLGISIKKLIRLQFLILSVLFLGYSEQFFFLVDYAYMNITGNDPYGLIYIAEVVSASKRTLARILVVIVCLGFGTVRPRLGTMNTRLLIAASLIYFSIVSVTSVVYALHDYEYGDVWYLRIIIMALDIAWFYWIFYTLVNTRRALKLRRNTVKLALYNSLGVVLIFAAMASFALIIIEVYILLVDECFTYWNERSANLIFWPVLFLVLQISIMIIWRPSNNDKRFAFVPLSGGGDEEGALDKPLDSEEGIVYRNISMAPLLKKIDEDADLQWAEENIPKGKPDPTESTVDTVLNNFIPSDEEMEEKTKERAKLF